VEVDPMLADDTRRQIEGPMREVMLQIACGTTRSGKCRPDRITIERRGRYPLAKCCVPAVPRRPDFRSHVAIALALAAVVGCHKSEPAAVQPNPAPATTQPAARGHEKGGQVVLDGSAVRSRLAVLTVGKENDAKQVVILGRPTGVRDIPEFSQPSRPDMLPREMVRQAVLIAAREELGLATRDEVIDETSADTPGARADIVEVVSYIRDNRSHEIIRRLDNAQSETIIAHETPTTPGRDLDLLKLLVSAESLSREEFPKVLKGMGLASKPNAIKEEAALPAKVDDRLTSVDFLDVLLAVRDVHGAMANRRRGWGRWHAAMHCWEFSVNFNGTPRTKRSKGGRCFMPSE
jgi:hypothetical protein